MLGILGLYWGYVMVMLGILGLCWGYMGIMDKKNGNYYGNYRVPLGLGASV